MRNTLRIFVVPSGSPLLTRDLQSARSLIFSFRFKRVRAVDSPRKSRMSLIIRTTCSSVRYRLATMTLADNLSAFARESRTSSVCIAHFAARGLVRGFLHLTPLAAHLSIKRYPRKKRWQASAGAPAKSAVDASPSREMVSRPLFLRPRAPFSA